MILWGNTPAYIYIMDSPSQTDLQRKIHEKRINIEHTTFFGSRVGRYVVRRLRKHIQTPLLDAGAGDGSLLKVIRTLPRISSADLYGVDLVPNAELGIKKGLVDNLPYKENTFKTIICTEVLEHLDTPTLTKALQEFYRVLQPGGHLITTFPFDETLARQTFTCPNCDTSFHRYGHVQSWHSKKAVTSMLKAAGFTIQSLEILPLGAVAKIPLLRFIAPLLNKLDNPPGLRKRAITVCQKLSVKNS